MILPLRSAIREAVKGNIEGFRKAMQRCSKKVPTLRLRYMDGL